MSRPCLAQAVKLLPSLELELRERFEVEMLPPPGEARMAFLSEQGARFDGLVTSAVAGADAALIGALPRLRVISVFGVGLDNVDLAAARTRGIPVGYTPDVLNDCVADHALALLLAVARRVVEADRFVRAGDWQPPGAAKPFPLGRRVSGARLGIVGLGRIGRTIARRAAGFEMEVRYHSRRPVEGVDWHHEPDLASLADWCDFLVVVVAGGEGTRTLVGHQVLQALGPQGFLVNVARGSVVDEQALVDALRKGGIAGAALDVFQDEPNIRAELREFHNVVLTPHIAPATTETRKAMGRRVLENLVAFFAGQPLVSAA